MDEKLFTVDEAEKMLPEIRKIMENVLEVRKSAIQAGEELARVAKRMATKDESLQPAELVNKRTEVEFLVKIIEEGCEAIVSKGAQVKDLDVGLIDFPAMINGELVLLCWKYGEDGIHFYHSLEDGFAGRKPLERKPELTKKRK